MLPPLALRTPDARRFVLAMYANAHYPYGDARWTPLRQALRDKDWSPTPEDCPVDWASLAAWYGEIPATEQRRKRKADAALLPRAEQRQD